MTVEPDPDVPGVLIVDDDLQLLRALRRRKYPGVRLFTANDEASTLALVAREAINVVIVDLRLGRAWGIDLIAPLRAAKAGLHIVIASAAMRTDYVLRATLAGANDVVDKPFEIPNVLERIVTGPDTNRQPPVTDTLETVEAALITRVYAEAGGNVSLTARRLGITRQRLVRKLDQIRAAG